MNKAFKKFLGLALLVSILFSIVGCSWFESKPVSNTVQPGNNETTSPLNVNKTMYSISDIKAEYANHGIESNYTFRPFYNVEQTTEFTFHFNSNVDPVKAISVHTDSKCEENSTVYQLNDGYKVSNGIDVVVKPKNSVLNHLSRDNNNAIWGYAPIYYLCIHYDLDSTTVKKLNTPIIIPFTITNKISTPNAYRSITSDGRLIVKWLPVEGAKSYKIYQSASGGYDKHNTTAEETGFYAKINYVETVDGSVLEYMPKSQYVSGWTSTGLPAMIENKDNLNLTSDNYVSFQNYNNASVYFVTAIDSNGNESFYSKSVGYYQHEKETLPYTLKFKEFSPYMSSTYLEDFPELVGVTSCDEKTIVNYPINFYSLNQTNEYTKTCEYRYEVVGTKLTGKITYHNEGKNFPDEVISKAKIVRGDMPEIIPMETIPSVDRDTFYEDYQNAHIDLASKNSYPESAKIKLDTASLYRRTELELAKNINDGVYTKSLDTIETYVANDNPEYIVIKLPNGGFEIKKNDGQATTSTESEYPNEAETPTESEIPNETKTPVESIPPTTTTKPEEVTEINNTNYVDEQRQSTERDVEEGNKETIDVPEYPVVANTAGQKYLAVSFINHADEISLKAFPEYQNLEELRDDIQYVWFQNPYIMTLKLSDMMLSEDGLTLYPGYGVDKATTERYQKEVFDKTKNVVASIIRPGMSDTEKILAIYDYLERNSTYNNAAIQYADSGATDFYNRYANSWNTYGILCEKSGVCQSYAYAFNVLAHEAGLTSVMATGFLDNGGHAWNAVKLNGKWYMLDVTNNGNATGIPYWICNSSTEFIYQNGFVLDDEFVDGTNIAEFKMNDNTKDWYYEHDLLAKTAAECYQILLKNKSAANGVFIKYNLNDQQSFSTEFAKAIQNNLQLTQDELDRLCYEYYGGVLRLYFE